MKNICSLMSCSLVSDLKESCIDLFEKKTVLGRLDGSVSAFGSGRDPRVLGSSSQLGSLLCGKPAPPSPTSHAYVLSLAVSLSLSSK